jgi:hypothetical protein
MRAKYSRRILRPGYAGDEPRTDRGALDYIYQALVRWPGLQERWGIDPTKRGALKRIIAVAMDGNDPTWWEE